ncbi:FtsQ-type POTRA domain-containing protein [Cryobacterium sp. PH29-G1]|uniref:FtsQ-type POTRA domain-containing protein n=1 Tax=Cryobacterium sp. PH29-G1 TaxID=3046211 RepID=UPI0024BB037F|nr:FtsQ-type POTRA domain-containing protein [Cryobacterium sp. PH29-G1]MDJ0348511.1 FtsQ-type POTRA domain-containing protein [Cryobacterium sp. PH29-G1]
MRRPAGFNRPAEPAPEAASVPTRKLAPGPKGSRSRREPRDEAASQHAGREGAASPTGASKPFDPNTTTTEPIVLAGPTASASLVTGVAGHNVKPAEPASAESASTESASTVPASTTSSKGAAAPPVAEPSGGTAGARAARSVLRGAQRARKRFERAEVRRFTGRTRRRRTAWIVGVGSIVLTFGLIIGAAYSPLMALGTIEVVGTNRIPAGAVSAALADQLGTPLPLIDAAVVKSELSQFTLIQSYVTESRPPGTLVVRIVERVPVGVLAGPSGFDLVDAAGVVIESLPERSPGYPLIDAPGGVDSAGFKAAAAVLAVLPESMRTQLDTVTAVTTDDVTLSLLGGERVVWGSPEKSEYKSVVLAALLIGHPSGTVNEYDVSSPDSAVLR